MALEFELNLILPHQNDAIFCRSSIEATKYLVKEQYPQIATLLSNTLKEQPLPLNEELGENPYQQAYYVDMTPEQVITIVEHLYQISTDEQNYPTPGIMALAKSLHKDWLDYANSLDMVKRS